MKIRTGDMIVIITGKEKGKTGRVLRVLSGSNRVVIAGANMRTKFVKRTQNQPGRRLHFEGSMDASNVMIVDPATGKRSRVGYRFEESKESKGTKDAKEAQKERFAKKSGKVLLSGKKLRKLVEEQDKESKESREARERKETKSTRGTKKLVEEKAAAPKRSAFWERLGFGKGRGEGAEEGEKREGGEVRRHDQSTRKAPSGER